MAAKILMIDDDREMSMLGKIILEREGYQFQDAPDGETGLEILRQQAGEIDLVLLDIMLPEMDGWETLQQIKADANLESIPVIMLTARYIDEPPEDPEPIQYAELYEDYVVKPFVVRELLNKISQNIKD